MRLKVRGPITDLFAPESEYALFCHVFTTVRCILGDLADIMVLLLGSDRSPWIEYGFEHPAPKLVKTHANKYAIVFTRLA